VSPVVAENDETVRAVGVPEGTMRTFSVSPATNVLVATLEHVEAPSLIVHVLEVAFPLSITVNA
jgi:hypothetical protein